MLGTEPGSGFTIEEIVGRPELPRVFPRGFIIVFIIQRTQHNSKLLNSNAWTEEHSLVNQRVGLGYTAL